MDLNISHYVSGMDSNTKANNAEADHDCKGGNKGGVRNMTGMGYVALLRVLQCFLIWNTQQQQQQQPINNNNNSEQIITTERGDPQSYPSLSNST